MRKYAMLFLLSAMGFLVLGCGPADTAPTETVGTESSSDPLVSSYLLESEPSGAIPVGEARANVADGQEITLIGVIGGSTKPFVEDFAVFTIVDPKVSYCGGDDPCPTPWDYCCTQDQVKDNIATVKLVDESGAPVEQDAKKMLGVVELSEVVVRGTAERDEAGNLTIAVSQVFVRK